MPSPSSHRTGQVLFTSGSSGRRVSPCGFPHRRPDHDLALSPWHFCREASRMWADCSHIQRRQPSVFFLDLWHKHHARSRTSLATNRAGGDPLTLRLWGFQLYRRAGGAADLLVDRNRRSSPGRLSAAGYDRLSAALWFIAVLRLLPGHRLSSFRSTDYHSSRRAPRPPYRITLAVSASLAAVSYPDGFS